MLLKQISTLVAQKIFRIAVFWKAPIFQKNSQSIISQKIGITFNASVTWSKYYEVLRKFLPWNLSLNSLTKKFILWRNSFLVALQAGVQRPSHIFFKDFDCRWRWQLFITLTLQSSECLFDGKIVALPICCLMLDYWSMACIEQQLLNLFNNETWY